MDNPTFENGFIVFPDGIRYTVDESLHLSKNPNLNEHDLDCIHAVKKIFNGMILTGNETIYEKRIKPKFHKFKKTYRKALRDEIDKIGESFGPAPIMPEHSAKSILAKQGNSDDLQLSFDL